MKAILEFSLPQEEAEFYYATNGTNLAKALNELDGWLRNKIKNESDSLSAKELEAYNNVRLELFGILGRLDIDK